MTSAANELALLGSCSDVNFEAAVTEGPCCCRGDGARLEIVAGARFRVLLQELAQLLLSSAALWVRNDGEEVDIADVGHESAERRRTVEVDTDEFITEPGFERRGETCSEVDHVGRSLGRRGHWSNIAYVMPVRVGETFRCRWG